MQSYVQGARAAHVQDMVCSLVCRSQILIEPVVCLPARQRDLAHKRLITHRETILTGEHCEHHPQRDLHDGEVLELLCREIGLANALQWVPLQVLREDLDEDSLTSTPTSDAPPFLLLACLVGA